MLRFGPLAAGTAHLCVDMQNVFAQDTDWKTPWMPRVLPKVESIARAHAGQTIFTRFIPPMGAEGTAGSWRRYYARWPHMTREHLAPRMIALIPDLAALVPPAIVVDKSTYSAWHGSGLGQVLRQRRVHSLVISGAETDVCILATVLDAVDRGYRVVLPTDALCSSSDRMHDSLLGLYESRFAEQIETATTEEILACWES